MSDNAWSPVLVLARKALVLERMMSLTSGYRGLTGRARAVCTTGSAWPNHGLAFRISASA
jgi:hypothetical protein